MLSRPIVVVYTPSDKEDLRLSVFGFLTRNGFTLAYLVPPNVVLTTNIRLLRHIRT